MEKIYERKTHSLRRYRRTTGQCQVPGSFKLGWHKSAWSFIFRSNAQLLVQEALF